MEAYLNILPFAFELYNVGIVYLHLQLLVFSASGVSKDTVLGPYPKTPEERAAAAKKYNMTVADYEPYPDKGEG